VVREAWWITSLLILTGLQGLCENSESVLSLRSRRQRKACGASPRNTIGFGSEPSLAGKRVQAEGYRPLSRAVNHLTALPGARAPGFMLTPASQAKRCSEFHPVQRWHNGQSKIF
jgi:hypothetical protein